MGFIGGNVGYRLLRAISPRSNELPAVESLSTSRASLESLIGPDIWDDIKDKVVIDFGCGYGSDAIEIAKRGAKMVVGIDIRKKLLDAAKLSAIDADVSERCIFTDAIDKKADVILTVDSFEHFHNPANVLDILSSLLKPHGIVWGTFGPTWYHPRGGHLFSIFPWAHLVFTESALIKWRSDFKTDGARRFNEVEGGLNQMTIDRFMKLVASSPLRFEVFNLIPIRYLRFICNPITQEYVTSFIRFKLVSRKT
jgi:SAM-dependent methyltransferase